MSQPNTDYEPPSEDELMNTEELRTHLREKHEEHVGVREFEEAHRRYEVLEEWRQGGK